MYESSKKKAIIATVAFVTLGALHQLASVEEEDVPVLTQTTTTSTTTTTTTTVPPQPQIEYIKVEKIVEVPFEVEKEVRVEVPIEVQVDRWRTRTVTVVNEVTDPALVQRIKELEQREGERWEQDNFTSQEDATTPTPVTTTSTTTTTTTTTIPPTYTPPPPPKSEAGTEDNPREGAYTEYRCEPNGNPNGYFFINEPDNDVDEGREHGGDQGCHKHPTRFHDHVWCSHTKTETC